jgi:hypothetical protein
MYTQEVGRLAPATISRNHQPTNTVESAPLPNPKKKGKEKKTQTFYVRRQFGTSGILINKFLYTHRIRLDTAVILQLDLV